MGNEKDSINEIDNLNKTSSYRSSFPLIVGILLIISGLISILYWAFMVFSAHTIVYMMDLSQIQQIYPNITATQISEILSTCSLILMSLAIFPILSGIFSLKKQMWGIVLAGGILGIFSIGPIFISSVICIICIILAIMAKKEYD